jgi:hypothetical protein
MMAGYTGSSSIVAQVAIECNLDHSWCTATKKVSGTFFGPRLRLPSAAERCTTSSCAWNSLHDDHENAILPSIAFFCLPCSPRHGRLCTQSYPWTKSSPTPCLRSVANRGVVKHLPPLSDLGLHGERGAYHGNCPRRPLCRIPSRGSEPKLPPRSRGAAVHYL